MKRKILFVAQNMQMNGANKSLCNLLSTIDTNKYEVDLFLYAQIGPLMKLIPNNINLLPEIHLMRIFELAFKEGIKEASFIEKIQRVKSVLKRHVFKKNSAKEDIWKNFKFYDNDYDVAIAYHEGSPHRFVNQKIKANKKIAWVHINYSEIRIDYNFEKKILSSFNMIVTVSENCKNIVKNMFGFIENKVKIIHNINSSKTILRLADELINPFDQHKINIVTVGRISFQKSTDIAIKACKIIKNRKYNICWYNIGPGGKTKQYSNMINDNGLQEDFILYQDVINPYPYIKNCNIYVQPSRFEGRSIAVTEAMIFAKPIIVSNISEFKEQIENDKNGLVVELTAEKIADAVIRLIDDKELIEKFEGELLKFDYGNEEEVNKFYELIEEF